MFLRAYVTFIHIFFCDTRLVSGDGVYDMIYYYYLIFDTLYFDKVKKNHYSRTKEIRQVDDNDK